ncbi:MAG: quercetin dioxygenase-like cupin family protein [Gammaproteobacteria bacterium]|jgi:quercetin dioxygenase-like cupin family protein
MSNASISSASATSNLGTLGNFKYEPDKMRWKDFLTPGTFYKLLHVDVESGQADMLVKFEAGSECFYHRHVAVVSTLVLQGELRVREQTPDGEVIKVKPAGSYSFGGVGEVHIEGAGDETAIIYFGMRTDTSVIYEVLNPDLSLKRAITMEDFDRDWREHWPEDSSANS